MPREPKMKMTKPATATAAPVPEIPDWATETPAVEYTLEAFFEVDVERVELTLYEYETLKRAVAIMRGIEVAAEFGRRHS